MAEKLAYAVEQLAWAPAALLQEPRGHKDLYGAILTDPCNPRADLGAIFMNNQGFEPMCGHALIGVVTSVLETGILPIRGESTEVNVETAVGLVAARAQIWNGHVISVAFENVPSFAFALDQNLSLADGRKLKVDVAFGGNYLLLIDASQISIDLIPSNAELLSDLGMQVLEAAAQQLPVAHLELPYISRILDVRFIGKPLGAGAHSRNVVVLGNRMIDRSPCGTGTSAELAVRYARRQLSLGEKFITEGILGTRFTGTVLREVTNSLYSWPYPVIVPLIEGSAHLTGFHQFVFNEEDPFRGGFLLDALKS
jgi:proline racemase